jgi:hypothetical protein
MGTLTRFDVNSLLKKGGDLQPPIVGSVRVQSVAATNTVFALPANFLDRMVTFVPDGNMYVVLGTDNTVTASPSATSDPGRAVLLLAGQHYTWFLAAQDLLTYMAAISASGTVLLRYWAASH